MGIISRVTSALIWVITVATLLISLLITTHEPPSTPLPWIQVKSVPQGVVSLEKLESSLQGVIDLGMIQGFRVLGFRV